MGESVEADVKGAGGVLWWRSPCPHLGVRLRGVTTGKGRGLPHDVSQLCEQTAMAKGKGFSNANKRFGHRERLRACVGVQRA